MKSESVGKIIASIYRNTQFLMDKLTVDSNLSSGTLDFLYVIINNEGLSQKELSEKLQIGKATTAKAVKKLIDLGYIKKDRCKSDNRFYELYVTEKGWQISELVNDIFNSLKLTYLKDFQEDEYEQLICSLNKVLKNVVNEINSETE